MGYGNPSGSWQDYQNQVQNGSGNTGRDWGVGLLGGPIGWAALAAGGDTYQNIMNSTDFMGIWGNTSANKNMTQDVYNSMSAQDWEAFKKMSGDSQSQFINQRGQELAKTGAAKSELEKKQGAIADQQQGIINQVQAFAKEMNMPVDQLLQQDEFAKGLQNNTVSSAYATGQSRGLGAGGISAQNADLTSKKALLGYQMSRQAAGQSALNNAYGMINTLGQNQLGLSQYETGLDMTNRALQQQNSNAYLAQVQAQKQQTEGALLSAFGGFAGMAGKAAANGMSQNGGSASNGPSYGTYNSNPGGLYSGYGSYGNGGVGPGNPIGGNY